MKLNVYQIRCIASNQGMNAAALAEKMGTSRTNVSAILKRGTCTMLTAGRIAKALGVAVQDITKEE